MECDGIEAFNLENEGFKERAFRGVALNFQHGWAVCKVARSVCHECNAKV